MRLSSPALAMTLRASLAACGVGACAREGAPPLAPVEVAVADLPDGGLPPLPPPSAPSAGGPKDRCTARLHALPIKTGANCTLDERISRGTGTLYYPCSGEGVVEAVFGEHRFAGTVAGGELVLALTTELDWEDGCHWQTRQALRGDWHRDADRSPDRAKLAWTYSERPIRGNGCYGSCKANADIEVVEETSP